MIVEDKSKSKQKQFHILSFFFYTRQLTNEPSSHRVTPTWNSSPLVMPTRMIWFHRNVGLNDFAGLILFRNKATNFKM